MNMIKLLSTVVIVATVNLNSLGVESGNLVGRESDFDNPSGSLPNESNIIVPGINEDGCVPVPITILGKLLRGEALTSSDHVTLCLIMSSAAARQNRRLREIQSRARLASADQVVTQPQQQEVVESHIGEHSRSTRIYCPPEERNENAAQPQSTDSTGRQSITLQNEGFFVQANPASDNVQILDRNREHIRTIETSEFCDTTENSTDTDN